MDDQPPHTVKDLLVELKDASELMVDLAYAAVFFNDDKIADEVIRLDRRSARPAPALAHDGDARRAEPRGRRGHGRGAVDRRRDPADLRSRLRRRPCGRGASRDPRCAPAGPASRRRDDRARAGPRRRACLGPDAGRAVAAHRDRHVGDRDPLGSALGVRPRSERHDRPRRRAADPRAGGRREPRPQARRRARGAGHPGERRARAVGARPGGRHPGRDERPERGGGRPRLLLHLVQQPRARRRGRRARGPIRPARGRAGELGAPCGARGPKRRRAPRPDPAGRRPRSRSATPRGT